MSAIALITGSSSGLGREFVRQVDNGAAGHIDEIWVVARRADRLESLVRTCKTPVRPFCLDLEDDASFEILEAAFAEERAANDLATIRLLVNNAGSGTFGAFAQQDKAAASQMMNLLMRAPVELIYRALPYMAPGSRIINVASVAAFLPQPKLAVYAAAKRFVLDMSRALNAELDGTGIHVTALCPKFMRTEFLNPPAVAGTGHPRMVLRYADAVPQRQSRPVRHAADRKIVGVRLKDFAVPPNDFQPGAHSFQGVGLLGPLRRIKQETASGTSLGHPVQSPVADGTDVNHDAATSLLLDRDHSHSPLEITLSADPRREQPVMAGELLQIGLSLHK